LSSEFYLGAVEGGHINILEWWWLTSENNELGRDWEGTSMCRIAAEGVNLSMLQWLHQKGCRWCKDTISDAAKNGHKSIIVWAHENERPWDASATEYAARYGNLELLRWLLENDCPLDRWALIYATNNSRFEKK